MPEISALYTYPVKSLGGNTVASFALDRFGPVGDRRWLVTDHSGRFLTQREYPAMARLHAMPLATGIRLVAGDDVLDVVTPSGTTQRQVTVWDDAVMAEDAGEAAADWLSSRLGENARLVHMPDSSHRYVDGLYAREGETVSFADGFPLLLISQASLDDLNARLSNPVPMNRFRPNLVVSGCDAFAEDGWRRISINGVEFDVAKPCARCVMPSIDQATGEKDSEILRVLAGYRRQAAPDGSRQVYFGQNLLYRQFAELSVGDAVEIVA